MIKLNNKNITYVALADSNNSLKAPKEIWYADSNNSVKLVYRRKDALIEGEDYEKYHWLKGDAVAYINTNYLLDFDDIKTSVFRIYNNNPQLIEGTRYEPQPSRDGGAGTLIAIIDYNLTYSSFFSTNGLMAQWNKNIQVNIENTVVMSKNGITLNGTNISSADEVPVPIVGSRFDSVTPYLIFASWVHNWQIDNRRGKVDYKSFEIEGKLHLVPCKLLKPVPKWLDANGIRRQVGECGMIDLVSGKFYGNVNSVGTFTVENYYERKQWLIIPYTQNDANALPIKSNNFNYRYIIYSVGNIAGLWTKNTKYAYYPNSIKCGIWGQNESTVVHMNSNSIPLATPFDVECNSDGITMNGELMPNYGSSPYFDRLCIYCYTSTGKYALSKITVDDSIRYIPCTLSIDLPASMDANNIARKKGTSGMWDLVSDRFYGNVASSGTFKAVNLTEGVDYEVHQWLVGDGTAYIDTLVNKLKGTITVDIDRTAVTGNLPILGREAYPGLGFKSRCVMLLLYSINVADVYGIKTTGGYGVHIGVKDTIYIDLDAKIISTKSGNSNSLDVGTDINGYNMLLFADNNGSAPSYCWSGGIGEFKMADVIHLVPCKLLRSIPSKYDANGIVRQAGECGMYDTVNDKFYGNVASSGTFSVSDDN